MNISFDAVYYEPSVLSYPLGQQLKEKYADLPWQEIKAIIIYSSSEMLKIASFQN